MKKASTRVWMGGGAAAIVLLGAGGYLLGVQPQQARAAAAETAAEASSSQTATVRAKVAMLSRAAAKQDVLESQAVVLDKAVPAALQANTFIRRVNAVAALDGVVVKSITVGASTPYAAPAGVTAHAAAAAAAASPAPSASSSPSPSAAPAASTTAIAPVLAATDPAITSANFTVIPMTVVVIGTADAGLAFVKDIQRDERLFLVSGLTTAADPDKPAEVTTTLTGSVYAVKH